MVDLSLAEGTFAVVEVPYWFRRPFDANPSAHLPRDAVDQTVLLVKQGVRLTRDLGEVMFYECILPDGKTAKIDAQFLRPTEAPSNRVWG